MPKQDPEWVGSAGTQAMLQTLNHDLKEARATLENVAKISQDAVVRSESARIEQIKKIIAYITNTIP